MISETSSPKDLFAVIRSLQAENAALRHQLYEDGSAVQEQTQWPIVRSIEDALQAIGATR